MSTSTTSTISMNGNSTAYGAVQGTEQFNLAGYGNTALLAGANDTVDVNSGEKDAVDLNSTGFSNAVTDVINIGSAAFDQVISSHALSNATVLVTAGSGPNTVSLTNHDGSTSIVMGSVGDTNLQGRALGDSITLNGDASNNVAFLAGGNASVQIGAQNDGFSSYSTAITLAGIANSVTGGDEAFNIADAAGEMNTISLGNGNSSVALAGVLNTVSLGNGNNTVAFSSDYNTVSAGNGNNVISMLGMHNTATLGTGSNTVTTGLGIHSLSFAAGGAGSTDTTTIVDGSETIRGGDENFVISSSARVANLHAVLGNGNNTIRLANGSAGLTLGRSAANTAVNTVSMGHGGSSLTFNGGLDTVTLADAHGTLGFDTIKLNATMLGTHLTLAGAFDNVTLTQDANAVINDTCANGGLSVTLDADASHGFGTVAITGLANDDLAQIHLIGAGAYTMTTDNTAASGITLHFAQGSIDLIGLQSVPNHLFGG